jgi:CDP-glycerol glycerophosphotransferase (TagB/SpsB family)
MDNLVKTPKSLETLVQPNYILIFIPNTNELQRFIYAGAFNELAKKHRLHYVLPSDDAAKMRAAAPDVLTAENTSELTIPPERFTKWSNLFQAACVHLSYKSTSFAIRANVTVESSKLLKVMPIDMWRPFQRMTQRLLRVRMPHIMQRVLKKINNVLLNASEHPQQFALIHNDKYDAYVSEVISSMPPLQEITDLFNRFKPLYCIVPTSLLDIFCNDVVLSCNKEQVTCVLLQSGWDNLSSKGILHQKQVYLGCWGPQSSRHAESIQEINIGHTANLGSPHYEFLQQVSAEEKQRIRSELGVSPEDKLVLFGGSFRQFDETSILKLLDKQIEDGKLGRVKILYRPHPWRAARQHEDNFFDQQWRHVIFDPDMRERYQREQKEKGYIKRHVPIFDMAYLSQILSAVDAVISPMSTLLVEAMIMEKPTMAIAFGDSKHKHNPSVTSQMTHFAELRNSEALIWCDSEKNFLRDCVGLLQQDLTLDRKVAKAQQRLLATIVTRDHGSYAERLAKFCNGTIEHKARRIILA